MGTVVTPDDWRRLADIFRVSPFDDYNPMLLFHQAADLFEEVADRVELERLERESYEW